MFQRDLQEYAFNGVKGHLPDGSPIHQGVHAGP